MGLRTQDPQKGQGWGQEGPVRTAQLWQLLFLLQGGLSPLARELSSSLGSSLGVLRAGGDTAFPAATVKLSTGHTGHLPYPPFILSVPIRASTNTIPVQK